MKSDVYFSSQHRLKAVLQTFPEAATVKSDVYFSSQHRLKAVLQTFPERLNAEKFVVPPSGGYCEIRCLFQHAAPA